MIKKTSIYVQFEDADRAWAGSRILGIRALGRRARGQVVTGAGYRLCSRSGYAVWVDFAKRISPVVEVCLPPAAPSKSPLIWSGFNIPGSLR